MSSFAPLLNAIPICLVFFYFVLISFPRSLSFPFHSLSAKKKKNKKKNVQRSRSILLLFIVIFLLLRSRLHSSSFFSPHLLRRTQKKKNFWVGKQKLPQRTRRPGPTRAVRVHHRVPAVLALAGVAPRQHGRHRRPVDVPGQRAVRGAQLPQPRVLEVQQIQTTIR